MSLENAKMGAHSRQTRVVVVVSFLVDDHELSIRCVITSMVNQIYVETVCLISDDSLVLRNRRTAADDVAIAKDIINSSDSGPELVLP